MARTPPCGWPYSTSPEIKDRRSYRFLPLNLILLIDDDATSNYVNQRLLKNSDAARHVDIALNGQEALDYLANRNASAGQLTPEAIFLDVQMPVMDGFGFLECYSHLPSEQRAQVLFILNSAASSFDRERLKSFPAVIEQLDAPLSPEYLQEMLRRHFADRFTPEG